MKLHLTVGAGNLDQSMDFYRKIPGLNPEWLSDVAGDKTGMAIHTQTVTLIFISLAAMERQHPALLQHLTRDRLGAGIQLEFTCPDLDVLYHVATRQQWPILFELEDQEHQRRELWLQDPDGYLLIFNSDS